MKYVIFSTKSKGAIRRDLITEDAIAANFLSSGDEYEELIEHPTEDRSALPVLITEGVYYQGLPIQSRNFSIFFTAQELASVVEQLAEDWFENNENP